MNRLIIYSVYDDSFFSVKRTCVSELINRFPKSTHNCEYTTWLPLTKILQKTNWDGLHNL